MQVHGIGTSPSREVSRFSLVVSPLALHLQNVAAEAVM